MSTQNTENTAASNTKQLMIDLLNLNKVLESLRFLAAMNIIQQESIVKGCKKFIKDHPSIAEYMKSMGREY